MNTRDFNTTQRELWLDIVVNVADFIEEEFHHLRKGITQTHYYVEVKPGEAWNFISEKVDQIPGEFIGFWRTQFADDNRHTSWSERLKSDDWVKVNKVIVTTESWEEK